MFLKGSSSPPEEFAQQRAWDEEFDARTSRLSLHGKIEALEAEIAVLKAENGEGEIVNAQMYRF